MITRPPQNELEVSRKNRLRLSDSIEIESEDSGFVTIYDGRTGERCRIGRSLYEILRKFRDFTLLSSAVDPQLELSVRPAIAELVRKGLLVVEGNADVPALSPLKPVEHSLFRVPSGGRTQNSAEITVLGVPFDGGNTLAPGASKGPAEIRRKSWQYQYRIDFSSGRPAGWFDVETEELLLADRTLRDVGDVRITPGESPEEILDRASRVCKGLVESGTFPVLLGGDHSVTYALVKALQSAGPLTVLWLDAHLDNAAWNPSICHHHGNVVTRLLQFPNIEAVVHIGHRGYLNSGRTCPEDSRGHIISAGKFRRLGTLGALESLRCSTNCYVSIDIDVLDPVYAPATSTPVPCGLTPLELKELLRGIGRDNRIVGMDLVEVNPSRDVGEMTTSLASEILMVAMASFTGSANTKFSPPQSVEAAQGPAGSEVSAKAR